MPLNRKATIDEIVDAYRKSGANVTFVPSTHTYIMDGVAVPSVTQFLSVIAQREYDSISLHYRNNAALIGTVVHSITEHVDAGNTIDTYRLAYELLTEKGYISSDSSNDEIDYYMTMVCQNINDYIDAYKKALEYYNITTVASEIVVGYRELPLCYAGKLDRIALLDGRPAIIDIKTSKKISRLAALQLTAYGMCAPKYAKDMLYAVLHLHRPKDRVVFDIEKFDYDEYYERLVLAALELNAYMGQ